MKMTRNKALIFISIILVSVIIAMNVYKHNYIKKESSGALSYALKGDYKKAIEKYSLLAEKDRKNPLWYCKISELYDLLENEEKSNSYFKKAKDMDFMKSVDATNYILLREYTSSKYKEATIHGEEALKKYKKNKGIINTMISLYISQGETKKAKDLVMNYPKDEKSSEDIASFGRMCMNISYYTKAFESLKTAYELDKDNIIILDSLSENSSSHFKDMVKRVEDMMKKNPNNPMYKIWLSKIYSLNETTCEEALKLLRGKDIPSSLSVKLIKLTIYSTLGDFYNSDKIVTDLNENYKDDYRVYHYLSWYYLKKGNLEKSQDYCYKSIEANPDYLDNYAYLMPEICKYMRRNSNSKIYLQIAQEIAPCNYNILVSKGDYYWYSLKNLNKSLNYYNLADKIKKNDSYIKYNLALIYLDNNKAKATELLKKCVELDPKENKYYRTLSVIYLNDSNYKEAEKCINKALSNNKNDIMTLNNLAVFRIIAKSDVKKGYDEINKLNGLVTKGKKYDTYTISIISKNFKKIKDLYEKYIAATTPTLPIPELDLFY
ncbi:tetratricopeptide repeat protein [Haloimpatiens sp. FM7315]|uniref:tetratricopeptide repeat protein n=1 Tax=Haloimpatiens sp. FM7315 TaxID=3298609 RepID=UPI0035A3D640